MSFYSRNSDRNIFALMNIQLWLRSEQGIETHAQCVKSGFRRDEDWEPRRSQTPVKFHLLFSNFNQITELFTKCLYIFWTPEWNISSHQVQQWFRVVTCPIFESYVTHFFCNFLVPNEPKMSKCRCLFYKKSRSLSTSPSRSRFHSMLLESCNLVIFISVLKEVNSKILL